MKIENHNHRQLSYYEEMVIHPPKDQLSQTIQFVIMVTYGLASIFLYLLNVIVLRRLKHTINIAFIRIYAALASASSLYFLTQCFTRFIRLGYFSEGIHDFLKEPNWFTVIINRIPSTYCPVLIFLLNSLISLHRVLAIISPVKSRAFWERFSVHLTVGCFILPVAFMWFVLPCRGYTYILNKGGLDLDYEHIYLELIGELSASCFAAIAGILFGSFTLVNTIIIFVTVKVRKIRTDTGMLVFDVLLAFFTIMFAISEAAFYIIAHLIHLPDLKEYVEQYSEYLIDLFILPPAWTLFFCNRHIRREALKMFWWQSEATITHTSNPSLLRLAMRNKK